VAKYGKSLLQYVPPGSRVLDLGCGTGELTAQLAETCSVTGVDADANMIRQAKDVYPHLDFRVHDMRQPLDESFDVVFSNAALHWIPPDEISGAIKTIASMIRPRGWLVCEFGGRGNVATIADACQQATGQGHPWYFPDIAEFAQELKSVGMEVQLGQHSDRPTPLEDGENGLANWLQMFGPWTLESTALAQVEDLCRPSLWKDDQWVADYRRIRILAQQLDESH